MHGWVQRRAQRGAQGPSARAFLSKTLGQHSALCTCILLISRPSWPRLTLAPCTHQAAGGWGMPPPEQPAWLSLSTERTAQGHGPCLSPAFYTTGAAGGWGRPRQSSPALAISLSTGALAEGVRPSLARSILHEH